MENFQELDLIEPLQRAVRAENYSAPTVIQARAIPPILGGRDLLGSAQTGTGKTAAFTLPILQLLAENHSRDKGRAPRALILSPTRELAAQIHASALAYGKYLPIKSAVIFGGVSENPQIRKLARGVDLLVATPGRFIDLTNRGFISLEEVEFFVLDEADRMLDMGFINDIRRIIKLLPPERQNLLFSATLPKSIVDLANSLLHDPARVEVSPEKPTLEAIEQRLMFVEKSNKVSLLLDLLKDAPVERAIIFSRTKHGANRLTQKLEKAGYTAAALHGNKSQNARKRALDGFKRGAHQLLVATDVAARGIDVDDVTHVFNFDLPDEPESYVHRIGRTGRAGRDGVAISFCDVAEAQKLRAIEKAIDQKIPADEAHAYHFEDAATSAAAASKKPASKRGGSRGGSSNNNGRSRRRRSSKSGGSRQGGRGRNNSKRGQRRGGGRAKSASKDRS